MYLPEMLYLVVATPHVQPVKRAIQGAYAWELVRCGAVRIESGQVFLVGMGEPELNDVLSWLRARTEPCTVPQLISHLEAPVGLLTEHLARRLTRLGFCEEKTVQRMLLFRHSIYPRTQSGEEEARRLQASFLEAALLLQKGELAADPRAVLGVVLLHVGGLLSRVLPQSPRGPGPEALSSVVKAGLVDRELMAELLGSLD